MQGKFEINWDHYPSKRSKLIYTKNRVGKKALQHLEPCLRLNFTILFTTIDNLFNHFEDIFGNALQKMYAIEKFQELKLELVHSVTFTPSLFDWPLILSMFRKCLFENLSIS